MVEPISHAWNSFYVSEHLTQLKWNSSFVGNLQQDDQSSALVTLFFEQKILGPPFNLRSARKFVLMTRTSRSFEPPRSCTASSLKIQKSPILTPTSISHLELCCTTLDSKTKVTTTFFGWARVAGIGTQIYVMSELLFEMAKAFQSTDPSTLLVTKCYDTLSDYELRSIST